MREINGRTRTCGLIGNPVAHTLSPLIHNTLAAELMQELVYVPFLVDQGRLNEAIAGAWALHIQGLNVTVPYKSEVIPLLSRVDTLAEKIGAVNTLVRCEDGYVGYNTDMTGLQRAMESDGVQISGRDVILLGAGGAARAVAFLCAYAGAERVWLLNRTIERARQVADEVNRAFERECILPLTLTDYSRIPDGKYLAIQGTSAGLYPNTEQAAIEDGAFYEMVHTGYDLIYKPADTRFMKLVRAHGGKAYNGLKMLAYQAIHAFELWNGVKVSEAQAAGILEKLKKETEI